jgi:hypothetical protein
MRATVEEADDQEKDWRWVAFPQSSSSKTLGPTAAAEAEVL